MYALEGERLYWNFSFLGGLCFFFFPHVSESRFCLHLRFFSSLLSFLSFFSNCLLPGGKGARVGEECVIFCLLLELYCFFFLPHSLLTTSMLLFPHAPAFLLFLRWILLLSCVYVFCFLWICVVGGWEEAACGKGVFCVILCFCDLEFFFLDESMIPHDTRQHTTTTYHIPPVSSVFFFFFVLLDFFCVQVFVVFFFYRGRIVIRERNGTTFIYFFSEFRLCKT
jgi:hypothetical protein